MAGWSPGSVLKIISSQNAIRKYAGPGHWNDPDMLEVGNGMTVDEDRAHFSMWCMLAAPLMAGNDLRIMTPETLAILTNKEVIAVDQDPLGVEAYKYTEKDSVQTWVKPLKNGAAVCFLNSSFNPRTISFNWAENALKDDVSGMSIDFNTATYNVRDLWAKKDLGKTNKAFSKTLAPHSVVMLRVYK